MRVRPLRLVWLLTLPLAGASPASASVHVGGPVPPALGATVTEMTGLPQSVLTATDVCGLARPNHARCDALSLVLRTNGTLVRPRVRASRPNRISPAARGPRSAHAAVIAAPAASPPEPGTPAYVQQAYDMAYLSTTGGSAKTVAIVDAYDDPNAEADLATYRATFGLPACTTANGCFKKVNQAGAASPLPAEDDGWETETSLDLDAVSALCPRCKILLVEANSDTLSDLQPALAKAASLGATQISNSWSVASKSAPQGSFTFAGVATVAASGDEGFVDSGFSNYPAAFAAVTAAGGTSLAATSDATNPRGFDETAWSLGTDGSGAGSGCDLKVTKPSYQTDSGCTGRAYSDVSAAADPNTGLLVYDSAHGGWAILGGTSLASPLIAAFYAAGGISAATAQWAYTSHALLNDPISGSVGTCATTIFYICNAGPGYDGPTGTGSISGAVVPGAPGIGGPTIAPDGTSTYSTALTAQSASLRGGVYPNGLDTTYWWEYGTTTDYGQQSPAADIGAGQAPVAVSDALSGLFAGMTYHYRLVAQNSLGTSYGYDYVFTTPTDSTSTSTSGSQTVSTVSATPTVPVNIRAPSITGAPRRGVVLGVTLGSWSPSPSSLAVQWQRGAGGTFTDIPGATGSTYVPVTADERDDLRVVVTARNAFGAVTAVSGAVGPVAWNPPVRGTAPVITGTLQVGRSLSYRGATWRALTRDTTVSLQWKRCRRSGTACRVIRGAHAARYRLTSADAGHRLVLSITASNPDANVSAISRPSGIVRAARAAPKRAARH